MSIPPNTGRRPPIYVAYLDIEADDIHAEASRLEALGARRIELVRDRWWVMEAPTGHRFCVVPMRDPERRAAPSAWE